MITTLDLALHSGAAWGEPGETPRSVSFQVAPQGSCAGEVNHKFSLWLNDHISVIKPERIGFLSPILMRTDKVNTIYRNFGLPNMVDLVCYRRGLPEPEMISEASALEHFTGSARHGGRDNKKAVTMRMCKMLGWEFTDDDAADALMAFMYMEHKLYPKARRRITLTA